MFYSMATNFENQKRLFVERKIREKLVSEKNSFFN